MKRIFLSLAAVLTITLSCNTTSEPTATDSPASENTSLPRGQEAEDDADSEKDVVKVAISSKDHSTLVKAVQAADLVTDLSNAGPFTVFAPVNAAFDALPKGTLDELLKPEKKADLQNILQYHVSVGVYNTNLFRDGQMIGQANGDNVKISAKDGKFMVNDANIVATVKASNGVIHVIDKVLLPPTK